jgi:proteasome assembly chaperone (PAC2) family protein
MQSIMVTIHDDSKAKSLLAVLRDLSYVEVQEEDAANRGNQMDEALLRSQIAVLEKVEW